MTDPGAQNPRVTISGGTLEEGSIQTPACTSQRIPFAAPPVGDLRWRPPQPATPWAGVRAAQVRAARHAAPDLRRHDASAPSIWAGTASFLNVWAPAAWPRSGYRCWSTSTATTCRRGWIRTPRYDGARLAQRGIIALNVNYRLNIFGFFAHPERPRSPPCTPGTMGIWTRRRRSAGCMGTSPPLAGTLSA